MAVPAGGATVAEPHAAAGLAIMLLTAAVTACATTHAVLLGEARPPISPAAVQIFNEPPKARYREIASLTASSRGSLALTTPAKIDKVVERLKKEAARLGANGVLLHGVGPRSAGSLGAGVSIESETGHSPYGLGFGTSVFLSQESGDALAIYVEPN
jgi:hypothetical protein